MELCWYFSVSNISRIFSLCYLLLYFVLLQSVGIFVWFLCWNCLNGQTHDAAFYFLPSSCKTSSSGLLPQLLRTCTWWSELWNLSHIVSFVRCLKLPAHDRRRWRTVSSMNCITKMFQISEAFLRLREIIMRIFRHVLTTDIFHTASISHTHTDSYTLLVYKEIMFDIPKLKLCSIDPEYCLFFFVFCHVIEDKCWKHSFKQSMRLKCTARKECIKYINKSIYLKSFVPKMTLTPCGNNATESL